MPALTTWAPFCAMVLPMWTMVSPWSKQSHGPAAPVKVARQQTTPELSRTFRTLPPQPTPTRAGTLRNPLEPSEPCLRYTEGLRNQPFGTFRNLYLLNLHQHTPEPSEIFRNLPPEPNHFTPELSGTFRNLPREPTPLYAGTLRNLPEPAPGTRTILHRNSPEPSGTCLGNLHQHTPELSGTFRNLPLEPAPAARTGTHRSFSGLKTPLAYAVGETYIVGESCQFQFILRLMEHAAGRSDDSAETAERRSEPKKSKEKRGIKTKNPSSQKPGGETFFLL